MSSKSSYMIKKPMLFFSIFCTNRSRKKYRWNMLITDRAFTLVISRKFSNWINSDFIGRFIFLSSPTKLIRFVLNCLRCDILVLTIITIYFLLLYDFKRTYEYEEHTRIYSKIGKKQI
jgi:hypothetical protein